MRRYLELFEVSEAGAEELDFIRIDVTEWSSEDVEEALNLLLEHARSMYEHYVVQVHECRHDEEGTCALAVVEVR